MVDPRVAELVVELIHRQVFDNDLDAWRAAKRVVEELDQMALENIGFGAIDSTAAKVAGAHRESSDAGGFRRRATPASRTTPGAGRGGVRP